METNTIQVKDLLQDLQRVAKVRKQLASFIKQMAMLIENAEAEGENGSGKLALSTEAEDLHRMASTLQQGVFRLLVLGDLKRGKSTFLNALVGETLLPANVTRCTAILTVIKYGTEKTVNVYFTNGKDPEVLTLEDFYSRYTIQQDEAERLDSEDKKAFPDVSHAVITYPLSLLENGVELIDSPGLNDTEERNDISLSFIRQSHAVIFVMSAIQPIAQTEIRYLDNYIKDRNIPVFFVINRWDNIKDSLIDPDDENELKSKEAQVFSEFKTRLAPYLQIDGEDLSSKRLFPMSALKALRQQLKGIIKDKHFLDMQHSINKFLANDRAKAEFKAVERTARHSYRRVYDAVHQRTSLLGVDAEELKASIQKVKPEFEKYYTLREDLRDDIRRTGDVYAIEIANAFRSHLIHLDATFEVDFEKYQPKLDFIQFLQKNKRAEFEKGLRDAFAKYINNQIAICDLDAEIQLREAFNSLNKKAEKYGKAFDEITENINTKVGDMYQSDVLDASGNLRNGPRWAAIMAGLGSLLIGDIIGGGMALDGSTFGWRNILTNIGAVIVATLAAHALVGVFLGPIGVILAAFGASIWQAEALRRKVINTLKEGLVKELPSIAESFYRSVHQKVKSAFSQYEEMVIEELDKDIQDHKASLDNLLAKLEEANFNREEEEERLKQFQTEVFRSLQRIEDTVSEMVPIQ